MKVRITWTEEVTQEWYLDVEVDSLEDAENIFHNGNHITGDEVLDDTCFIDSELNGVEEIK